jgi:hypothetical protein
LLLQVFAAAVYGLEFDAVWFLGMSMASGRQIGSEQASYSSQKVN